MSDEAPTPAKRTKRPAPDPNRAQCTNCRHFTEATEAADEVRWGFCDRYPPTVVQSEDEDGAVTIDCVRSWVELPHVCGEHGPRLQ